MQEDSVVFLETAAAATLVCFRRLANRNSLLAKRGCCRVKTYPANARFKSENGRIGGVRVAADIPVGIAGAKGHFAAWVPWLGSRIPRAIH